MFRLTVHCQSHLSPKKQVEVPSGEAGREQHNAPRGPKPLRPGTRAAALWAAVARGTLADARESDFRGVWHLPSSSPLPPTHTSTATSTTSTPLRPAPPHHKPPSSPPSPPLILKRLQPRGRVRRLIFSQSDTPTPTPRALGGKTGPHWRHGAHRGLRGSRSTDMPNYHPVAAARQHKKRIAPHSNENQRRREQQRRASPPAAQRT